MRIDLFTVGPGCGKSLCVLSASIVKVDVHDIPEPGDGDLLDLTAIQTLIKGGNVYAVSPGEAPDQAKPGTSGKYRAEKMTERSRMLFG